MFLATMPASRHVRRVSLGPPQSSPRMKMTMTQHSHHKSIDNQSDVLDLATPVKTKRQYSLGMDSAMHDQIVRLAKTPQQGKSHNSPRKSKKIRKPTHIKDTMLIYTDVTVKQIHQEAVAAQIRLQKQKLRAKKQGSNVDTEVKEITTPHHQSKMAVNDQELGADNDFERL